MKRHLLSLLLVAFGLLAPAAPGQQAPGAEPAPWKPVLLVIDIQNDYLPMMDPKDVKPGMETLNALIDLFRENHHPIVRVYHTTPGRGPEPGSEGFRFPASVRVREEDARVVKNHPSAFVRTELDRILREKGGNTLYLCGLSAVGCVLATYFGAAERDYDAYMVSDAIISHNAEYTDFVRKITRSVPTKALSLQMKILSGDLGALETQPVETLRKDYGIDAPALLNRLGYYLLLHRRPAEALTVFKANVRLFPDDPNSYDSLGEALERDNRKAEALASYEKAVLKAQERKDPLLSVYEKNRNRLKEGGK